MSEAFPLHWPQGWPRTAANQRQNGRFEVPWTKAVNELLQEIERLGGTYPVISSDLELRKKDGLPYAGQRDPEDTGVAVYFLLDGEQRCIPCDRYNTIKDNVRAVGKTIEAMRGIERWGTGEMMKRTFQAFAALPSPEAEPSWWETLGIAHTASLADCELAYKAKARTSHPDAPLGSHEGMARLNSAIAKARIARQ